MVGVRAGHRGTGGLARLSRGLRSPEVYHEVPLQHLVGDQGDSELWRGPAHPRYRPLPERFKTFLGIYLPGSVDSATVGGLAGPRHHLEEARVGARLEEHLQPRLDHVCRGDEGGGGAAGQSSGELEGWEVGGGMHGDYRLTRREPGEL